MPRIFDNIENRLLPALQETVNDSYHADFCVGYFNLRGWKELSPYIERFAGESNTQCRILVGMQRLPQDELREALYQLKNNLPLDNQTALRLKKQLAEEFREQLTIGIPTNADEIGLQQLAAQIRDGKVVVRLFLRHHKRPRFPSLPLVIQHIARIAKVNLRFFPGARSTRTVTLTVGPSIRCTKRCTAA
jgi:hypothetical protein